MNVVECLTKFNQLILLVVNIFVAVSRERGRGRERGGGEEGGSGGGVGSTGCSSERKYKTAGLRVNRLQGFPAAARHAFHT